MRHHPPQFPLHHLPPGSWRSGRRFFWPFAMVFGGIILLFFIAIGVVIYLAVTQGGGHISSGLLIPLCGIPIAFFLISMVFSGLAFRRFGRPMSEVFTAIDSVTEGDLSVRVPERYPGRLGQLARRFNHMIGELERAEQQRRNLTADIAHELRTPLHIIQGNLEGILDGVYEPTAEKIKDTLDETKLLARLVGDLQTLSLAEAGQLPLHSTRFLLADLIQDLTSSFSSRAASLGIAFQTSLADPDQQITADYDRLNQVLSNLISNALRHTPSGGKVFIQTMSSESNANSQIQITLRDTGSGIPPEDLPFLFDRFWTGDKSRSERVHSGLGLAIAKQLILAHGGTITVDSEVGAGTSFAIELPANGV
ncbi:MAG: HAMP domain-containing histidine kinase [Chloroflexi bacterium]|nr:HAMP domain-containing histidine kinase [Chloroflexota bacterium]